MIYDHDQLWYFLTLPQAKRWDYRKVILSHYAAIARLGLPVKVLRHNGPWPQNMPLLIAPAMQMVDDQFVRRLDEYASGGGNLLLTARTGLMDRTGQLWEGPTAAPIVPLIGGNHRRVRFASRRDLGQG